MRYGFTIVFNGKHTLRACARNALKSVDKLVIVEGAVRQLAHLSNNGHSTDGTLEIIQELKDEFGDRVIPIIGQTEFWLSKLDMCNEALRHIDVGAWIVEFDADEFYFPERLNEMMEYLERSDYNCAEVWGRHYYGDLNHHIRIQHQSWGNSPPWRRMFRYDGRAWVSHEPPRLPCGKHEILFDRETASEMFGVEMHHVGYCWRDQVELKAALYDAPIILKRWEIFNTTGSFHPANNGPTYYAGPRPWKPEDFE